MAGGHDDAQDPTPILVLPPPGHVGPIVAKRTPVDVIGDERNTGVIASRTYLLGWDIGAWSAFAACRWVTRLGWLL